MEAEKRALAWIASAPLPRRVVVLAPWRSGLLDRLLSWEDRRRGGLPAGVRGGLRRLTWTERARLVVSPRWGGGAIGRREAVARAGEPVLEPAEFPAAIVQGLAAQVWPPPVTVVVPVHNGGRAVAQALDALRRHRGHASVILVDDASTDEDVLRWLEAAAEWDGFSLHRNETNLGFSGSVNRGVSLSDEGSDVVVLNSDAILTPWAIRRLMIAAYGDAGIASATPMSDNAGPFTIDGVTQLDRAAAAIGMADDVQRAIDTPTPHGFCMYLRREALRAIGVFDQETFRRGYGEENDWAMRARRLGWRHVLAGRAIVGHVGNQSFGDEKTELLRRNRAIIDERYPEYTRLVRDFVRGPHLEELRAACSRAVASAHDDRRTVAFLLHDGSGGTPKTTRDLAEGISERFNAITILASGKDLLVLDEHGQELETRRLRGPVKLTDGYRADYVRAILEIFDRYSVDILHARSLIGHALGVVTIAKRLGMKVFVSFHDYYLVCPTVHLLDENAKWCGGRCTPTAHGDCPIPAAWARGAPALKHGYLDVWRAKVSSELTSVDAFITTAGSARDVVLASYPELASRFHVIEHGRDFEETVDAGRPPVTGAPLRLLLLGNIGVHKGLVLVERLLAGDRSSELEFHLLGKTPPGRARGVIRHGTYTRETVVSRIAEIRPSWVMIPSIWAETYSHTVTEAWAAGVPVLGGPLGAVGERIERSGAGLVMPVEDASLARAFLSAHASDLGVWEEAHTNALARQYRSKASMAADYLALYESTDVAPLAPSPVAHDVA